MTQTPPDPNQSYRSSASNRNVIPGWMNLSRTGKPDTIEIQFDLDEADLSRDQATLLVEYWPVPGEIGLQSLLPVRAFKAAPEGWCVFVPAEGMVMIRAIDTQPTPPQLSAHGITLDPTTQPGTQVNVRVNFPKPESGPNNVSNLQLNN